MHVQEGEGWRLLVDPARHPFGVLIGGAGWAAELTAPEASALQQGLARLLAQRELLAGQLMAEEALTLELDLEPMGVLPRVVDDVEVAELAVNRGGLGMAGRGCTDPRSRGQSNEGGNAFHR